MSNDEKSNNIEEVVDTVKDTMEDAVEVVKDTVEDAVDAVKDTVEDAVDAVTETVDEITEEGGAVSKIMDLKESNPKVFFGAIAGVIVILVLMFTGGGSAPPVTQYQQTNLSIGNTYTLRGVNTTSQDAKVRLVAIPGSMAAYDENKEDGSSAANDCKHIAQGASVKLLQIQEAFGGATFVQVELLNSGKCTGRNGWATASNLK